jgi:hypothetical protein
VSITELSHQLTTIEAQLAGLAERGPASTRDPDEERPGARTEAGLRHLSKQLATVQAQLTGVAEHVSSGAVAPGDRPAHDRTTAAITELSQQLAATQAQVTSLSAQLTTLAHRVTYDLERGAQTTTERLARDLPGAIGAVLAAELGPAIDDLTDQVEADRTALTTALEAVRTQVTNVTESIEGLPLSNVEVMTSLKALEHDIEDRLARLANRLTDQVATLERSNAAELVRVRDHVADLHDLLGSPNVDAETLDRMAGQVERLSQRAGGSGEVVDALELLIAEHLEVLRDEIEGRVGALAPMLQEELEAVRSEAVAGVGATEDALAERLEALETAVVERLDAALAEQLDGLDGMLDERLTQALGSLLMSTDGRLEELASATAAVEETVGEQLGAITGALTELQERAAESGGDESDEADAAVAEALANIAEELQGLRRRITLRADGGEGGGAGLSDAQLDDLAERLAARLRQPDTADTGESAEPPMPPPRHAASSRSAPRRTPRAAKRS